MSMFPSSVFVSFLRSTGLRAVLSMIRLGILFSRV